MAKGPQSDHRERLRNYIRLRILAGDCVTFLKRKRRLIIAFAYASGSVR